MNTRKELEEAIEREVRDFWPDADVTFTEGGKHPKAKLTFGGKLLSVPFSGTSGSTRIVAHTLADIRRALRKLGATRSKPDPTPEEDEAPYRPANNGREERPDPIKRDPVKPKPTVAEQLVSAGVADKAEDLTLSKVGGETMVTGVAPVQATHDDADDRKSVEVIKAEFQARVEAIVDGIYFGLPADVYHAVPRLSSSGIQKLCVSPATFWRGSWLDPDRPEPDEDETIWQIIGRAYHTARLEPHLFEATYVRELEKSEAPKGTLFTATDMGKQLEEYGLKKSGSVLEQAERLADAGFPANQLWPLIKEQWEADRQGRTKLPAKHYDQMVTDSARISANSDIAPLLQGGEAEVSIFWTDEYGLPMKARMDYLTRKWWSDFKTFDNTRGKNLNQALVDAVRYNRYYIQASVYREAAEAIRKGGLQIVEAQTDDQRSLIASLQIEPDELRCWFIFQEKGGIPNLLAREFPFYAVPYQTILNEAGATEERKAVARAATSSPTDIFTKGKGEVKQAKAAFKLYSEIYKPGEPWFPIYAVDTFRDDDFSAFWLAESYQ